MQKPFIAMKNNSGHWRMYDRVARVFYQNKRPGRQAHEQWAKDMNDCLDRMDAAKETAN
jgi:hypothetical protein